MTKGVYRGPDRRRFIRLDYVTPLAYKVCKPETISKLLEGYTANVSNAGLLCHIKDRVHKEDILWLSFDRGTLIICQEIEKRSLVYQNGIIGKVVRIEQRPDNTYNVGVQFITREEKNSTYIFPKIQFLNAQAKDESRTEES